MKWIKKRKDGHVYKNRLTQLANEYANVKDLHFGDEEKYKYYSKILSNVKIEEDEPSADLLKVGYLTDQSQLSDSRLESEIKSATGKRSYTVDGIDKKGTIKGGTNRVKGPYLVYEFKPFGNTEGELDDTGAYYNRPISEIDWEEYAKDDDKKTGTPAKSQVVGSSSWYQLTEADIDASRFKNNGNHDAAKVWNTYKKEIILAANEFGVDPYLLVGLICMESDGKLNGDNGKVTTTKDGKSFSGGGLITLITGEDAGFGLTKKHMYYTIVNGKEVGKEIDSTMDTIRGDAELQIRLGAMELSYYSNHLSGNIKDNAIYAVKRINIGLGGGAQSFKAWFGTKAGNSQYFEQIRRLCFPNDEEAWVIVNRNGAYVRVYTSSITGEITREEPASMSPSGFGMSGYDPNRVGSIDWLLSGDWMEGYMEPYVYVIKEDIDFTYYFKKNENRKL